MGKPHPFGISNDLWWGEGGGGRGEGGGGGVEWIDFLEPLEMRLFDNLEVTLLTLLPRSNFITID